MTVPGKEFISSSGYVCYRLPHKQSISKAKFLYQEYNNEELAEDEVVIFLNGNNRDFSKENLYKVTKRERLILNRMFPISTDAEETLTNIQIVRLKIKRIELAQKFGFVNERGEIIEDRKESKRRYEEKPEVKEHKKIKSREYMRKKRQDPEFIEKEKSKRKTNEYRKYHADWKRERLASYPEYREIVNQQQRESYARNSEKRKEYMRKKRADPEYRAKEREYRRKRYKETGK